MAAVSAVLEVIAHDPPRGSVTQTEHRLTDYRS